jgi:hypothetical protein
LEETRWIELKSRRLKRTRGVSFEEITEQRLVAIEDHPSIEYQKIMLYEYRNYIWAVPFVRDEKGVFLKTLYPSRKHTKKYLKERP